MRLETEALILHRVAFQESSLVLQSFTRGHGMKPMLARGIRRNRKDGRRGALAGFHTVSLECVWRSSGALATLTRAEIVRARPQIPSQGMALAAAQVVYEVLHRFIAEGDAHEDLFALVEAMLDDLEAGGDPLSGVIYCLGRIISALGYGWRMDVCAGCGVEADLDYFSIKRHQTVCRRCGDPYANRLFQLSPPVRHAMEHLDWPPTMGLLSHEDAKTYYRICINCLRRLSDKELSTDPPFRRMMDQSRSSTFTHEPTGIFP